MSASLVGSEMCIRDRSPTIFAALLVVHQCRPARIGWQHMTGSASSNLQPVSYTHLTLPTICSV
eukprot:12222325-Alexandrium_andersonii.AAC.1